MLSLDIWVLGKRIQDLGTRQNEQFQSWSQEASLGTLGNKETRRTSCSLVLKFHFTGTLTAYYREKGLSLQSFHPIPNIKVSFWWAQIIVKQDRPVPAWLVRGQLVIRRTHVVFRGFGHRKMKNLGPRKTELGLAALSSQERFLFVMGNKDISSGLKGRRA